MCIMWYIYINKHLYYNLLYANVTLCWSSQYFECDNVKFQRWIQERLVMTAAGSWTQLSVPHPPFFQAACILEVGVSPSCLTNNVSISRGVKHSETQKPYPQVSENGSFTRSTARSIEFISGKKTRNGYKTIKHLLNGLVSGKIYRKAPYVMGKSMVSCKFSLKPIQSPSNIYIYIYINMYI